MSRLMIASVSILIVAAGAASLNFTFTVTSASITTSGTSVSVSGPATLTVSGVGSDSGTFSASGSLANISGGDVTVPFTDTFGYGTLTGNMTFPAGVLVGSAPVSGSATITSGTGPYSVLANTTVTGSGFSGGALSGGKLSFTISGAANGRNYTFAVTNASVSISGTSMFSGAASLTLSGNSPDTGTFSATGSLNNTSGGNLTVPFTVTLGHGTITGNMTFPETVLVNPGTVSGSATITGGTGSYAGYTSSTLTASGTVTGSVLSGGTLSFSVSGAVSGNTPTITEVDNGFSNIANSPIESGTWVAIKGTNLSNTNPGRGWNENETFPTSMDGTSVTINGKPAFVYFISPGQVNVQAPTDAALGPVSVVLTNNGVPSAAATATYQTNSPALLQWGGGQYPYALMTDGATYVGNPAVVQGSVSAHGGEVLTLWATGLGSTDPPLPAGQQPNTFPPLTTSPVVTVSGINVTVLSAVLRYAGLYQVNVQLPASLQSGDLPIKVIQGSFQSPDGVLVNIQP